MAPNRPKLAGHRSFVRIQNENVILVRGKRSERCIFGGYDGYDTLINNLNNYHNTHFRIINDFGVCLTLGDVSVAFFYCSLLLYGHVYSVQVGSHEQGDKLGWGVRAS